MAVLPYPGVNALDSGTAFITPTGIQSVKAFVIGEHTFYRIARDVSQGTPATPSMKMTGPGKFRFYWPVLSGARSISVDVKYSINATPRPKMTVKANVPMGVMADVSASAASSASWVTIGPLNVSPSIDGVLIVELAWDYDSMSHTANWDNLVVT